MAGSKVSADFLPIPTFPLMVNLYVWDHSKLTFRKISTAR